MPSCVIHSRAYIFLPRCLQGLNADLNHLHFSSNTQFREEVASTVLQPGAHLSNSATNLNKLLKWSELQFSHT